MRRVRYGRVGELWWEGWEVNDEDEGVDEGQGEGKVIQ